MIEVGKKVLVDMKVEFFMIYEAILVELRRDGRRYHNFQTRPGLFNGFVTTKSLNPSMRGVLF